MAKPKVFKIGKRTTKSKFESDTYMALVENLGKGGAVEYEPERFDYVVGHKYCPDFKVRTRNGKVVFIETKGNGPTFDHAARAKLVAFKEQHPEIDLRILFQTDGAMGPKRKDGTRRRQSDWAVANGFKFAIRHIPEEWFNE
jgi:hypothetical protein